MYSLDVMASEAKLCLRSGLHLIIMALQILEHDTKDLFCEDDVELVSCSVL
jgi:hypothetical protein